VFSGPTHFVQEPIFVARKGSGIEEGDGWVMALVDNVVTMASELHIVDTREFGKSQAIIDLPIRLRAGLHGKWVDAQDLKFSK
jgi:carotenoid cleavage dioxygenase-like enzyme